MAKTLTITTATPIRITAEHYQLESQSAQRAGKVYDLFFNREARRWECSCPDARPEKGNNPNCKHVRRLRAWIHGQMNSSQAQREASEIVQRAPLAAEPLPSLIEEKIAGLELALAQQVEMIVALQEELKRLQTGNDALVYEVLRLQAVKHSKGDVTQGDSEAVSDRKAWEEFEKDPEAGRAKQAEKIRAAALNRGNDGFSMLKK